MNSSKRRISALFVFIVLAFTAANIFVIYTYAVTYFRPGITTEEEFPEFGSEGQSEHYGRRAISPEQCISI